MRETALIFEVVEAESVVQPWRTHYDPIAARGVPAHISLVYPFLPLDRIDDGIVNEVAAQIGTMRTFDYELVAVEQFPSVVWLRPDPAEPFRELTRRLAAAFPECPPYEGRFSDIRPHLTVALTDEQVDQDELAARIRQDVDGRLPIRCRAETVWLLAPDEHEVWHRARRFALRG